MPTATGALQLRAATLLQQAITLHLVGEQQQALALINTLIAEQPALLACLLTRAQILSALERHEEALQDCHKLFGAQPAPPAWLAVREDIGARALASLDAEHDSPHRPHTTRARYLRLLGRHADALKLLSEDLEQLGASIPVLSEMAENLMLMQDYAHAIHCYAQLEHLQQDEPAHAFNLGNALRQLNRCHEAMAAYQRCLTHCPDQAEAQLELAHCYLTLGDYAAAWPLFESRWRTTQLAPHHLPGEAPLWTRERALQAGDCVLLWAEQGLGDSIQFLRYLPEVQACLPRDVRLVLRVPQALRQLVHDSFPHIPTVEPEEALPAHRYQCPLMSLPHALAHATPNAASAYLRADPARAQHWEHLLNQQFPDQLQRWGLVWAGRQFGLINRTRDLDLETLLPRLPQGLHFVSLQKDIPLRDQALLPAPTQMWRPELGELADTAALLSTLDGLITVDTALAHLAGALGIPTLVLLRHSGEWRWQLERTDSPWYASHHLLRQPSTGDWAGALLQLAVAMQGVTASRPEV